MGRQLATIRRITAVKDIPGADRIVCLEIGGWEVVDQKAAGHRVDDLVVYCEIDSFLPVEPEFEFLRPTSYKRLETTGMEGFRLRTVRLRKQISQGLVLPLDKALAVAHRRGHPSLSIDDLEEHTDLTSFLGIVKYETQEEAERPARMRTFPELLFPRTEEVRVQNLDEETYEMAFRDGPCFYFTEKVDGSSVTVYLSESSTETGTSPHFGVCSRNQELDRDSSGNYWPTVESMGLERGLRAHWERTGEYLALQGELLGEKIQKNRYKFEGRTIRFFTGFRRKKGSCGTYERLGLHELEEILRSMDLDLRTVPVLHRDHALPRDRKELLRMAEGKSVLCPSAEREGFVIRRDHDFLSFKVISNKFLLKNE